MPSPTIQFTRTKQKKSILTTLTSASVSFKNLHIYMYV